jgi:hypothetical protein
MKKLGIFGLLLGVALGSGCVRTMVPILEDKDLIADSSLAGEWVQEGSAGETLRIAPPDSEKSYNLEYTDDKGKSGKYIGRLGRMGELTIAEIRPVDLPEEWSDSYKGHFAPLISFFVVSSTKPALRLRAFETDWLKEYVRAHPGELSVASSDEALITSGAWSIRAFVLKHWKDVGALSEEGVFVRPKKKKTV